MRVPVITPAIRTSVRTFAWCAVLVVLLPRAKPLLLLQVERKLDARTRRLIPTSKIPASDCFVKQFLGFVAARSYSRCHC
jgi:hypothetical protein